MNDGDLVDPDNNFMIGKTVLGPERSVHDSLTIWVVQMIFNNRITVGPASDHWTWDDAWCFRKGDDAFRAFEKFDGEGEPEGWIKHPLSGRYRPDADPSREFNQRLVYASEGP